MRRLVVTILVIAMIMTMAAAPAVAEGGGTMNCGSGGYATTHSYTSGGSNHFLAPHWVAGFTTQQVRTVYWAPVYSYGWTDWSLYVRGTYYSSWGTCDVQ